MGYGRYDDDMGRFAKEFIDVLINNIRRELKTKVMTVVEPEIDAVIEEAMKAIKIRAEANKDVMMDRVVVHLMLNDKKLESDR